MSDILRCRYCGADIRWAATPSGRAVALDVQPTYGGESDAPLFHVDREGRAIAVTPIERRRDMPLYREHFVRSPHPARRT